MVRRSSCTTRRKDRGSDSPVPRRYRVNGNESGQLIETCAGLLDNDEPEVCIRKEAIEETGYEVGEVRKLFELYMSPGGVTELIHFLSPNTVTASALTPVVVSKMKILKCLSCRSAGRWR